MVADLDGDGLADLVYHDYVRGNPELGVCTAAGSRLTIRGIGQSELLEVIALPTDGRHVILFGATSISAQFYEVAVVVHDRLTKVRLPDGAPLTLSNGLELGRVERSGGGGVWLRGERHRRPGGSGSGQRDKEC
ncbi:MAG TPA: hypothetical protein VEN95_12275 [Actinomycetota bacterium]|nr:hypothetical protein [Actinomycetota bacterium]